MPEPRTKEERPRPEASALPRTLRPRLQDAVLRSVLGRRVCSAPQCVETKYFNSIDSRYKHAGMTTSLRGVSKNDDKTQKPAYLENPKSLLYTKTLIWTFHWAALLSK